MTRHYVYIVRCADRSLYTGYARDPLERTRVHNNGRGARYTCGRRPVRLVYSESFATVGDALRREHELKRLPKAAKEALVANARAQLRDGYDGVVARSRRRALSVRTKR
jgi:putative endonuclease